MGIYQTLPSPGGRPENGHIAPPRPPELPSLDGQPFFLALDEAMRRPLGARRPGRPRSLWRRRLVLWVRQKRLGLWLALLIGLCALAYALAAFTDASHRYGPDYYEPKDIERWQWLQRAPR